MHKEVDCVCQRFDENVERDVQSLLCLRIFCSALRALLPDEQTKFLKLIPDPATFQDSASFLAYKRGYLPRLTRIVHQYLNVVSNTEGKEIAETWLSESTREKKRVVFKKNFGKLVELFCADYFESIGAEITEMDIWKRKESCDIEYSLMDEAHYVEVKYVGEETEDFVARIPREKESGCAYARDLYGVVNYLILRIYEAGKQLEKRGSASNKEALIIVDSCAWGFCEIQIKELWMVARGYRFHEDMSCAWQSLLASVFKEATTNEKDSVTRLSLINDEAHKIICKLDLITVCLLTDDFHVIPQAIWSPVAEHCQ